jgi:WD40 repeat protein
MKSFPLLIWNTSTWEKRVLSGHLKPIVACAFSPDGVFLFSADEDGIIKVWEPSKFKSQSSVEEYATLIIPLAPSDLKCLALHPWKPTMVVGGTGGTLYMMDIIGITYGPIILTR